MTPVDERVTRPALRWHGGKYLLAPWICEHFPKHRIYVEPYGGAASVLLRKPRAYSEVYNDLDAEVVNLFRVLRDDETAAQLTRALMLTPYARTEFLDSRIPMPDADDLEGIAAVAVERARRLVVRSFMGFGSDGHNVEVNTGFRANANRAGTTPAHDWANFPPALQKTIARLRGVVIENKPALAVMKQHDGEQTLHYVDPPYLPTTRSQKSRKSGERYHGYAHEMSAPDHVELLQFLQNLSGMVVLSGYHSDLYDDALTGWQRFERQALADGAQPRLEVLWLNPHCASKISRADVERHKHPNLFT